MFKTRGDLQHISSEASLAGRKLFSSGSDSCIKQNGCNSTTLRLDRDLVVWMENSFLFSSKVQENWRLLCPAWTCWRVELHSIHVSIDWPNYISPLSLYPLFHPLSLQASNNTHLQFYTIISIYLILCYSFSVCSDHFRSVLVCLNTWIPIQHLFRWHLCNMY